MGNNPYLQLIRPANLITSATDILAGVALATLLSNMPDAGNSKIIGPILLVCSSLLLYAGGIAFNDIFDLKIDTTERPERPLPSGRIPLRKAVGYATVLLALGILLAFLHHRLSGFLAIIIATFALIYNKWGKHHTFFGPFNMGFLRGINLLLGLSLIPEVVYSHYLLGTIPWIYIFTITLVSRGEVHGGRVKPLLSALALYIVVDGAILSIGFRLGKLWLPMLFALLHLLYILPPLFQAIQDPVPPHIRKTVKHGVLGIIIIDALWVSITEYWYLAFLILLLLPLSQKLARYFAVT